MDGPPFMCDRSSNANGGVISGTTTRPSTISLRKAAFTPAALVVPGSVL